MFTSATVKVASCSKICLPFLINIVVLNSKINLERNYIYMCVCVCVCVYLKTT